MNTKTDIKNNYQYTHSFYYKPDKKCPHCGEVIENGTDLNKPIIIRIKGIKDIKK